MSTWGRQVVNNGQNLVNVIKERPYNSVVPGGAILANQLTLSQPRIPGLYKYLASFITNQNLQIIF